MVEGPARKLGLFRQIVRVDQIESGGAEDLLTGVAEFSPSGAADETDISRIVEHQQHVGGGFDEGAEIFFALLEFELLLFTLRNVPRDGQTALLAVELHHDDRGQHGYFGAAPGSHQRFGIANYALLQQLDDAVEIGRAPVRQRNFPDALADDLFARVAGGGDEGVVDVEIFARYVGYRERVGDGIDNFSQRGL